jgi:type I restriction enzyme S subunit
MSLKSEFRLGITVREVAFGQDCKALLATSAVDPWFLFFSLRSRTVEVLNMVDEAGHGTGRLATDRLEKMRIALPPLDDQRRIAIELKALGRLAAARQREIRALAELRGALLPGLISGKIRIRDAEKAVEEI